MFLYSPELVQTLVPAQTHPKTNLDPTLRPEISTRALDCT